MTNSNRFSRMSIDTSIDLRTRTSLAARLKRRWPLWAVAGVALVVIGWLTLVNLGESERNRLAETLELIADSEKAALELWLEGQKSTVAAVAGSFIVRETAMELARLEQEDQAYERLLWAPVQEVLASHFDVSAKPLEHIDFTLVSRRGVILAAGHQELIGERIALEEADPKNRKRAWYFVRALAGAAVISKPFLSRDQLPDRNGQLRSGLPTMHLFAPIRNLEGDVIAAIDFRIDPGDTFTRILRIARLWSSGETYAFDGNALLLTQSRFEDQLRSIGLLPNDLETRSILHVQIRDPGGDMTDGFKPRLDRVTQPPTLAVANAVAGREGVNADGYRDYRGVEVVGAWRWLEQYDFGIVSEVDAAEAYSNLTKLNLIFGGIFGLLTIATIGSLTATVVVSKLRSKVNRAETKLQKLGKYTLLEKIGEGGLGEVHRARHALLRRPTAIKTLKSQASAGQTARFEREVQLTSQLTHPNTIRIYDYGRTPEGAFYYVMEYLEGINLDVLVRRYGAVEPERAKFILLQTCASLREAHAVGLIHRDIKPANIFLSKVGGLDDFVKLLDFGLVRTFGSQEREMTQLTQAGTLPGTPAYVSPESAQGKVTDQRSDIYALGCVAYWLLTNSLLFEEKDPIAMALAHVREKPIPVQQKAEIAVPDALAKIVDACLSKSPDDRPQTVDDLMTMLQECRFENEWSHERATEFWSRHP